MSRMRVSKRGQRKKIDPTATDYLYVSIKNYECFDEEGSLNVGRIVSQLKDSRYRGTGDLWYQKTSAQPC